MDSARLVAQKIRDLKITTKAFMTSSALASYLRSMLSVPCRAIGRKVPKCIILYQTGESSPLAYTDDVSIFMNAGHPILGKCRTRVTKVKMLIGLMVHEFGHYRFTDMAGHKTAIEKMCDGQLSHAFPKGTPKEILWNKEAFSSFWSEAHPAIQKEIVSQWHDIYNILEDAYVEECCYRTISGQLIDGLTYTRKVLKGTAKSVSEMMAALESDRTLLLPCVRSLLLSYAKYGSVRCNFKSEAERNSEPMKWLGKVRGFADALLYESNTKKRLQGVNSVFLTLWPLIEEYLRGIDVVEMTEEELDAMRKKFSGSMDSSSKASGARGKGTPVEDEEDTGVSGSSVSRKRTIVSMKKAAKECDGETESASDEGSEDSSASTPGKKETESTEAALSSTETADSDGETGSGGDAEGEEDKDAPGEVCTPPGGTGFLEREELEEDEYDARALEESLLRIEREVREETAVEKVNEELTKELSSEAKALDYGAAHRGIDITLKRISRVDEEKKAIYARTHSGVEAIADTMVRKVLPLIKKDADTQNMPMSGFFSGGRFDAARLINNDWRYFRQNTTPTPDTRLALSILVDESGSMGCRAYSSDDDGETGTEITRIEAARMAALALYLFCEKVGIKCSVLGHTSKFGVGDLELYAYADYETPDKDDKYRILSISAKQDNRDGAAILFAGEHLLKREEPTKLMFIICDGAPLATGYSGVAAENDMANIVKNLRRKGVIVFAAAIGGDKDNIHRIFGEGFLDITKLATLPDQLLQLIKRYIR